MTHDEMKLIILNFKICVDPLYICIKCGESFYCYLPWDYDENVDEILYECDCGGELIKEK